MIKGLSKIRIMKDALLKLSSEKYHNQCFQVKVSLKRCYLGLVHGKVIHMTDWGRCWRFNYYNPIGNNTDPLDKLINLPVLSGLNKILSFSVPLCSHSSYINNSQVSVLNMYCASKFPSVSSRRPSICQIGTIENKDE